MNLYHKEYTYKYPSKITISKELSRNDKFPSQTTKAQASKSGFKHEKTHR